MQAPPTEAGEGERLSVNGGGVCIEPGATQTGGDSRGRQVQGRRRSPRLASVRWESRGAHRRQSRNRVVLVWDTLRWDHVVCGQGPASWSQAVPFYCTTRSILSLGFFDQDEVDPMVSVMKVEKAPVESYADIGGLDSQIQEIKEAVELPLTHDASRAI